MPCTTVPIGPLGLLVMEAFGVHGGLTDVGSHDDNASIQFMQCTSVSVGMCEYGNPATEQIYNMEKEWRSQPVMVTFPAP